MDTVYGKPNPSSGLPIEVFDLTGTGGGTFAEAAPILGWDGTTLLWRRVAVDTKGQLIISNPGSGGGGGGTASIIQVIGTDGTTTSVGYAATNTSVPVSFSGTNIVAGTVTAVPTGTQTIAGTAAVTQVTSPWVVSGTTTSIPSGTTTVVGTVTNVPSGTQSVAQTGSPWGVSGTVTAVESGTWSVTVSGTATTAPTGTQTVVITGTVTDSIAGGTVTIIPSGTQSVSIVGTTTVIGTVTSIPSGTTTAVISGTATVSDAALPQYLDYSIQTNVRVYSNEMIDRLDTIISLLQQPPVLDTGYNDVRTYGVVGPMLLSDGQYSKRRHGKTGELLIGNVHGQYVESVLRGNVFFSYSQTAVTAGGTALTGLTLYNPINSGINVALLDTNIIPNFVLSTSTAIATSSTIYLYVWGLPLTGLPMGYPTGATVNPNTFNALVGTPQTGKAIVYTTCTFPVAPSFVRPIGGMMELTPAGFVFSAVKDVFNGLMIIPPGVYLNLIASPASGIFTSLTWEEIPIS